MYLLHLSAVSPLVKGKVVLVASLNSFTKDLTVRKLDFKPRIMFLLHLSRVSARVFKAVLVAFLNCVKKDLSVRRSDFKNRIMFLLHSLRVLARVLCKVALVTFLNCVKKNLNGRETGFKPRVMFLLHLPKVSARVSGISGIVAVVVSVSRAGVLQPCVATWTAYGSLTSQVPMRSGYP